MKVMEESDKPVEKTTQQNQQVAENGAPLIFEYDANDKKYKAYGNDTGLNIPFLIESPDGEAFDLYYLNISREELRKAVGIL